MPAAASPSAYPRHPTNANVTVGAARGGRILLPRPHVVDRPHRVEGAERGPDRPFETEWRSRLCAPPAGNTRRDHPAPGATEAAIPGRVTPSIGADFANGNGGRRVRRVALPPRRTVVPAGLIGGPFNFKGFPPSGSQKLSRACGFLMELSVTHGSPRSIQWVRTKERHPDDIHNQAGGRRADRGRGAGV